MKRCKMCGCLMDDKHDDVCECCLDDMRSDEEVFNECD